MVTWLRPRICAYRISLLAILPQLLRQFRWERRHLSTHWALDIRTPVTWIAIHNQPDNTGIQIWRHRRSRLVHNICALAVTDQHILLVRALFRRGSQVLDDIG